MPKPAIHIMGASGSGTSTLGKALAQKLEAAWLDTDNYYWYPSTPRFQEKRPIADRLELLQEAFTNAENGWILSGSLESWGESLVPSFGLVVFLELDNNERMERLIKREAERHGENILPGGSAYESSKEFLQWSYHYEDSTMPGRNRKRHEEWLKTLPCKVLRLDSSASVDDLVKQVMAELL